MVGTVGKMKKIRIFDSSFTPFVKSFSLREENKDVKPTHFEWTTEGEPTKTTFIANGEIKNVQEHMGDLLYPGCGEDRNIIALLTEPPNLHPEDYQAAFDLHKYFSHVFTFSKEWYDKMNPLVGNTILYSLGGSSFSLGTWGMQQKIPDKKVCMFISDKDTTEGHKFRHEIYKTAQESTWPIDFYGEGVGKPVENKFDILSEYLAVIVVESCRQDFYWSEKLIDALSMGCMVYYWGCPSIGNYFRLGESIMPFDSMIGLSFGLGPSKIWRYFRAIEDIIANLEEAKKYRISEDWLFDNHRGLFT